MYSHPYLTSQARQKTESSETERSHGPHREASFHLLLVPQVMQLLIVHTNGLDLAIADRDKRWRGRSLAVYLLRHDVVDPMLAVNYLLERKVLRW